MNAHPSTLTADASRDPFLDNHDAVPRDGPAVFVVDARTLHDLDTMRGIWIDFRDPAETLAASIEALLGHPAEQGGWMIIDQVGLGPMLVEEEPTLASLGRLAMGTYGREPR